MFCINSHKQNELALKHALAADIAQPVIVTHTSIGLAGSLPSPKEGKKLHRVSDRITMRERLSHYRSFFILHSDRMFTLKERITFRTVTDILIRRTLNFTTKLFAFN